MSNGLTAQQQRHNVILSEMLVIALILKMEYVDHIHNAITAKEYELIERMKGLIEEFEELDVSG